jgi:hypothetical protein
LKRLTVVACCAIGMTILAPLSVISAGSEITVDGYFVGPDGSPMAGVVVDLRLVSSSVSAAAQSGSISGPIIATAQTDDAGAFCHLRIRHRASVGLRASKWGLRESADRGSHRYGYAHLLLQRPEHSGRLGYKRDLAKRLHDRSRVTRCDSPFSHSGSVACRIDPWGFTRLHRADHEGPAPRCRCADPRQAACERDEPAQK